MTQQEFIDLIPQVLLYIVPGFFVLMIIESFTVQKRKPPMETILWSIFYSFLVEITLHFLRNAWYSSYVTPVTPKPLEPSTAITFSVILSGMIGFILVKLINSDFGCWIVRILNPNLEPRGDFWFESLKSDEGVWAIVYMKNGMVYQGQVITYNTDPNDPVKMLTLTNICSKVPRHQEEINEDRKANKADEEISRYRIIRNDTDKPDVKVLLKFEDILSIELGGSSGEKKKGDGKMD